MSRVFVIEKKQKWNDRTDEGTTEKKQEAIKPYWYYGGKPFCGNCGHILENKNRCMMEVKCQKCGRSNVLYCSRTVYGGEKWNE